MSDLLPATAPFPPAAFTPPPGAQAARVTIAPAPSRQLVSLQCAPGARTAVQAALKAAYGVELPVTPAAMTGRDGVCFIWSGLDQWLASAPDGAPDLATALRDVTHPHAAITRQGDGRATVRVSGPDARAILCKLVPIDLHPRAFGPGSTALTLAGHVPVQILRQDMAPTYDIFVFRSLAHSLHHDLCHAACGGVPLSEMST
ncbi:sarcosine oxidase subunit gamma [Komagataeibacter swingsii]|uniref:Sarcosine oxidase subunit gamma n=1 Tax=Komagataeibacter swingsii TaxID=215220 RepID=A0A2V4SF98_9PROT|nr:sarcosine oxidase subunit gamma family protein [Komagataeibacter swingsii]PYD70598.1 sarcosine oxidase subunit gamma [Komagataeibacter swingsii]GBQ58943.1 sarcosine oxidase gamma subunit [Komagataeibacter swingsii DSM 16373]